ncbi:hypothetical protein CF15_03475 [Pyrodictium occultum]|uniref:polynucleotide 5'-hydroxyl-kinase n=1 Tax=Pyrodictium occultum TaxID=2309 RepID=A0A0V8RUZ9_PYROC|nr:Clp1/GlmU family protein [Pyrodictium occultum]KSW11873.1 hypothetical protein CF15_03475 [Pyrodictium occultum]
MPGCFDVARGSGLWVSGPARVAVERGSVYASGYTLEADGEALVRGTRGFTFYAIEDSRLCVHAGAGATARLVREGFETVEAWNRLVEELASRGFRRLVVAGPPDSGKSTLTAWLRNRLELCVVEADVGQNELGLPGMVAYAPWSGRALVLQDLEPAGAFFVGHVSAEKAGPLLVSAAARAARACSGGLVADTDGFIQGRGAFQKAAVAEAVGAEAAVVLGSGPGAEQLSRLLAGRGLEVFRAPSPGLLRERSRVDRRSFRQRLYAALFARGRSLVLDTRLVGNLCPYQEAAGQIVYTCGSLAVVESQRRAGPGAWVRPGWARGLLAGLSLRSGVDEPALVEQLSPQRGRLVVRVPEASRALREEVLGVTLGWVRLGEGFREEEHLEPGFYPEATAKTRRR